MNDEDCTSFAGIWRITKNRITDRITIKGSTKSEIINEVISHDSNEGIIKLYKLNEENLEAIPVENIIVLNEIQLLMV